MLKVADKIDKVGVEANDGAHGGSIVAHEQRIRIHFNAHDRRVLALRYAVEEARRQAPAKLDAHVPAAHHIIGRLCAGVT